MLWIPITLAAATFQVLRTSRQHELRAVLSPGAAGFVRYLYGAPFAWALAVVWFSLLRHDVPSIPPRFWPLVTAAGVESWERIGKADVSRRLIERVAAAL